MASAGLHVEVAGQGPALVLAHGFGGSARNWRPQVRSLRDAHRVLTYDARGHARSEAPASAAAYDLDAAARDFASVLADAADAERPAVVGGLSMGAAVALEAALRAPDRVRGLILASYPAGPGDGRGPSARAHEFAAAIDAEGLERAGARFAWGPDSGLDERGASWVRQGFLEHAPRALAHTLRELLAALPPLEERVAGLSAAGLPLLVLAGANDAPALPVARRLASVRGAELTIVPDAGHVVNLAQPAAVTKRIRAFMDRLG